MNAGLLDGHRPYLKSATLVRQSQTYYTMHIKLEYYFKLTIFQSLDVPICFCLFYSCCYLIMTVYGYDIDLHVL